MCTVVKVIFIILFFFGLGVSSDELATSEETGPQYKDDIQTLAYRFLNNKTIIFYDYEKLGSNLLYIPVNVHLNRTAISHLFTKLVRFVHAYESPVSQEDTWIIVDGYYGGHINLTVPFGVLVTLKQRYIMYNRILKEIAENDAIVNKPYNYTIYPGIVLEVNLIPSYNIPNYGNMTLRYYKYVQFCEYIWSFYKYIILTAYSLIILGSLLICTSILKYNPLKTPPNVYVFSLAVSDILHFSILVIGYIYTQVSPNNKPYESRSFLPITLTVIQMCWYVVCWTATGITVDRYIAICHPFLARRVSTKNRAVKINIAIWSLSLIITMIELVYGELSDKGVSEKGRQSATRSLILMIIVPMCIILPAYICIIRNILKSSRLRESCSTSELPLTSKSFKIAAVIGVQFFVCFAPTAGYTYVMGFINPNKTLLRGKVLSFTVLGLNILGCMLHPVLYALVSIHFRKAFKAHQSDRKAENHVRYKRFDEATLCHQKASDLLLQAMQLTSVSRALESLQLQHDYHIRQKDIVRVKKIQFEIQKKILDYRNRKMTTQKKETKSKDQDLQWAIFRTMEEADSLLSLLILSDEETNDDEQPGTSEKTAFLGHKKAKTDHNVIEELQTLNTQLRALITQLLTQLDASEKQVEALKARLRAYEEDFPCPLPDLAPLEIPQYEYSSGPDDIFPDLDKSGS